MPVYWNGYRARKFVQLLCVWGQCERKHLVRIRSRFLGRVCRVHQRILRRLRLQSLAVVESLYISLLSDFNKSNASKNAAPFRYLQLREAHCCYPSTDPVVVLVAHFASLPMVLYKNLCCSIQRPTSQFDYLFFSAIKPTPTSTYSTIVAMYDAEILWILAFECTYVA